MDFGTSNEYADGAERRMFERVGFGQPVAFQAKDPVDYGGSLPRDISQGGIRLYFNDFLPLGTELSLQIPLAPQKVVECLARVVWVRQMPFMDRCQAGLRFVDNDSRKRAAEEIQRFVHLQKQEKA